MIAVFVLILLGIIMLEFIIAVLKYMMDGEERNREYYQLCDGCQAGFCMAEPGSDECKKIREELYNG